MSTNPLSGPQLHRIATGAHVLCRDAIWTVRGTAGSMTLPVYVLARGLVVKPAARGMVEHQNPEAPRIRASPRDFTGGVLGALERIRREVAHDLLTPPGVGEVFVNLRGRPGAWPEEYASVTKVLEPDERPGHWLVQYEEGEDVATVIARGEDGRWWAARELEPRRGP